MAIQKVDVTVPGGDTPRSANIKINANFSDTTHAASKLVGAANGQIPLFEQGHQPFMRNLDGTKESTDNADDFEIGTRFYCKSVINAPAVLNSSYLMIETHRLFVGSIFQTARTIAEPTLQQAVRRRYQDVWGEWMPLSAQVSNYTRTTGTAPNVTVDSYGRLMRSTSSERYKNILSDLVLTDERYEEAMQVKPIIYRSLAEADPDNWHYISFSAEEIGSYDPAFTFWQTHKVDEVTGETVALAEKQAEGINLNAITAMLHATNIKQAELIKGLELRIEALENP